MRSLQDEIRQAQRDLFCPICHRHFELKDIRLQTFDAHTKAELSVVCNRGHFPVILLVPVVLQEALQAGPITERELRAFKTRADKVKESVSELVGK